MLHSKRDLALALHDIGALQFKEVTLKSGLTSPFYFDLRLLISHPDVLSLCIEHLVELIRDVTYDRIAAIPYAGLPIGTGLSLRLHRPMIFPRKEVKAYGLSRLIEGKFNPGERALVVDDLITRGGSKVEAIAPLIDAGLVVTDIAVILDRESGGVETLAASGICVHAAIGLTEMLDILQDAGKLEAEKRQIIDGWLEANK